MTPLQHEYKVMGIAPYGSGRAIQLKEKLKAFQSIYNGEWKKASPFNHFISVREQLEGYRFDHIASGIQSLTEDLLSSWIAYWVNKTGIDDVAFSGGLALNVKANAHYFKSN